MNYTIGTEVQRKGSSVIWKITGISEKSQKLQVTCSPKGHTSDMSKWIDFTTFAKNWVAA